MTQASSSSSTSRAREAATGPTRPKRMGKRTAAESRETRRALLAAAAAAFCEQGFNGAKLDDIANRAGVTKGAIYSHFEGREDLLVQACRSALRDLNLFQIAMDAPDVETFVSETAKAILAPGGKALRMLNIEVHLSAARSEVMAKLLADWHAEGFRLLEDRLSPMLGSPEAIFSMMHVLFLGLSHIDSLSPLGADRDEIHDLANTLAKSLIATN